MNIKEVECMSEKKSIEYEIDEKQGTLRVRYKFDFDIPDEQMNFPLGTDEDTIVEALKRRYNVLKNVAHTEKIKKTIEW